MLFVCAPNPQQYGTALTYPPTCAHTFQVWGLRHMEKNVLIAPNSAPKTLYAVHNPNRAPSSPPLPPYSFQVWDLRHLEKDVSFHSRLTYAAQVGCQGWGHHRLTRI